MFNDHETAVLMGGAEEPEEEEACTGDHSLVALREEENKSHTGEGERFDGMCCKACDESLRGNFKTASGWCIHHCTKCDVDNNCNCVLCGPCKEKRELEQGGATATRKRRRVGRAMQGDGIACVLGVCRSESPMK